MKRIEAVLKNSALDDFHRCAKQLGIFGFDLSEKCTSVGNTNRSLSAASALPTLRRGSKWDFAVLDEDTEPTVHAVLISVNSESIAIFKFDQDTRPELHPKY